MEILTQQEKKLYEKNILLFGEASQLRLKKSRVLVIGAGGSGSAALAYLASMGVGFISIADGDNVSESNLQRQIAYTPSDVGKNKALCAKKFCERINPYIHVGSIEKFADENNLPDMLLNHDFVLDCTDGIVTKLMINDACLKKCIPFCYCGIEGFQGQIMTVIPGKSLCLKGSFCSCKDYVSELGTTKKLPCFAPVCGVVGSLAASEAVKYFIGNMDLCINKVYRINLANNNSEYIKFSSNCNKDCNVLNGEI